MANEERTGWRDEKLSRKHREWGIDLPMVDVDFLAIEADRDTPAALIEYKNEHAKSQNGNDYIYRVLRNLAAPSNLPLFAVRYSDNVDTFLVVPLNSTAIGILGGRKSMNENAYVSFLRGLRCGIK